MEEETKAMKRKLKKTELRCKKLIQIVAQNEVEGVKKSLEMRTKERDMYKEENERQKANNKSLRTELQRAYDENQTLKKKIMALEQDEDLMPQKRQESITAEIEYEVNQIKQKFQRSQNEDQAQIDSL